MVEALASLDEHLATVLESQHRVETRLGEILTLKNSGRLRGLGAGFGTLDLMTPCDRDMDSWKQRLEDAFNSLDTQQRRLGDAKNATKVAESALETEPPQSTELQVQVDSR